MKTLLAIAILLAACPASAKPWIAYGQTYVGAGGVIDNPVPNVNGVEGEVTAWPFTVPAGCVLVLEYYAVESYNSGGIAGLFPWIGPGPVTNSKALPTAAGTGGTVGIVVNARIPASKQVNIRLMNGQAGGFVYGWHLTGQLIELSPGSCSAPCSCP